MLKGFYYVSVFLTSILFAAPAFAQEEEEMQQKTSKNKKKYKKKD